MQKRNCFVYLGKILFLNIKHAYKLKVFSSMALRRVSEELRNMMNVVNCTGH
jgi:hypothetical protein